MKNRYLVLLLLVFSFLGCKDRDKIISLDLPPYQPQNVLEFYLEKGVINRLLLTKSASFQDTLYPVITNAFITVSNNNTIDTLIYKPLIDTVFYKIFDYQGKKKFDFKVGERYSLNVKLNNGEEINGTTTVQEKVDIETVTYQLSDNQKKYNLTVKFKDNQIVRNFYRAVFDVNGVFYNTSNIDYLFDDTNLKTTSGVVITNFRFNPKDTVIVSLYNISEDYYRYLRSVKLADNANGNPFAQPASIKSNITGGIGIFTHLVYDRDTIYLPK